MKNGDRLLGRILPLLEQLGRSRAVGECKVELGEEEGPVAFMGVKSLGEALIFLVLVIGPNVPPLLQNQLHSQQLSVANVVISLSRVQVLKEKGAGVELLIHCRPLQQDSSDPNI